MKIHSQTSNDIRNQFSKDQIQRAVDKRITIWHYSRSKKCDGFSPANFLLFFFCFCTSVLKKTHTREKKHTTTHRKTHSLSLRNINTLRTNTEEKKLSFSLSFFFSLVVFRGNLLYIYLCLRLKRRERDRVENSSLREERILNIRSSRARELRSHHHRHKKEANKCRTRKKRPRRKR